VTSSSRCHVIIETKNLHPMPRNSTAEPVKTNTTKIGLSPKV
jgi:hypothetical protein